jgi:hypothetical protein
MKRALIPPLRIGTHYRVKLLADFLNATSGRAEAERVLALRENLVRLQAILAEPVSTRRWTARYPGAHPSESLVWTGKRFPLRFPTGTVFCEWDGFAPLRAAINRQLTRYQFRQELPASLPVTIGVPATISARPRPANHREKAFGEAVPITETHAVSLLLALAEDGALGCLRQCEGCRVRWLAVRHPKTKYCPGPKCSKRDYRRRIGKSELTRRHRVWRENHQKIVASQRDKVTIFKGARRNGKD